LWNDTNPADEGKDGIWANLRKKFGWGSIVKDPESSDVKVPDVERVPFADAINF